MAGEVAAKVMERLIERGDADRLRKLLQVPTSSEQCDDIAKKMSINPIALAIRNRHEECAIILVKNNFSTEDIDFQEMCPVSVGESYCIHQRHGKACPAQATDVMEMAKEFGLDKLTDVLEAQVKENESQTQSDELTATVQDEKAEEAEYVTTMTQFFISSGNAVELVNLLQPLSLDELIPKISADLDVVMYAIEQKEERIACYLVECGFPYHIIYYKEGTEKGATDSMQRLDESKGQESYDAITLAEGVELSGIFLSWMQDIAEGKYEQGDRLSEIEQMLLASMAGEKTDSGTDGTIPELALDTVENAKTAIGALNEYGVRKQQLLTKGDSVLHECAKRGQSGVVPYLAYCGMPINEPNQAWDTPLHIAIRRAEPTMVVALLRLGANSDQRNKMGITPRQEATENLLATMQTHTPSLKKAIEQSDLNTVKFYIKNWCYVHAKILNDITAIQLAELQKNASEDAAKVYRALKEYERTSELIHAVFSEEVEAVKQALRNSHKCAINMRQGYRYEITPLAVALASGSLEIVEMLVDSGADMRMRIDDPQHPEHTMPMSFAAIGPNLNGSLLKYICQTGAMQLSERDTNGNSLLLRMIRESVSEELIVEFLVEQGISPLMQRNREMLTARQLAEKLGQRRTVYCIDEYLIGLVGGWNLVCSLTSFYGVVATKVHDGQGKSLVDIIEERGGPQERIGYQNIQLIEERMFELAIAAAKNDLETLQRLDQSFQDVNGYTALTRAVVFGQVAAAKYLIANRAILLLAADNLARGPLHYAYALVEERNGEEMLQLLLRNDEPGYARLMTDHEGRLPSEYRQIRNSDEIRVAIQEARCKDVWGNAGEPLDTLDSRRSSPVLDRASSFEGRI